MSIPKNRLLLHEDRAVVILRLLTIVITLAGLVLPVPVYIWSDSTELFSKVLSDSSVQTIVWQLLFVTAVAGCRMYCWVWLHLPFPFTGVIRTTLV